jgi:hypothetical protein
MLKWQVGIIFSVEAMAHLDQLQERMKRETWSQFGTNQELSIWLVQPYAGFPLFISLVFTYHHDQSLDSLIEGMCHKKSYSFSTPALFRKIIEQAAAGTSARTLQGGGYTMSTHTHIYPSIFSSFHHPGTTIRTVKGASEKAEARYRHTDIQTRRT